MTAKGVTEKGVRHPLPIRRTARCGSAKKVPDPVFRLLGVLLLFPFLVGFRWPWETARLQREAAASFEKGAYGRAAEVWSELSRDRPGDPQLAYNLGTAKLAQKEYAQAIESLGQGLGRTTDPAMINKLRYNRGNAYYRLDDPARAAVEYEAALKANPDDEDGAYTWRCAASSSSPGGRRRPERG